jgi:hypothetical protein
MTKLSPQTVASAIPQSKTLSSRNQIYPVWKFSSLLVAPQRVAPPVKSWRRPFGKDSVFLGIWSFGFWDFERSLLVFGD